MIARLCGRCPRLFISCLNTVEIKSIPGPWKTSAYNGKKRGRLEESEGISIGAGEIIEGRRTVQISGGVGECQTARLLSA